MLKYKSNKKIKSFILKLLFCGYSFSCFAIGTSSLEITPDQQKKYINHSVSAFFQTKQNSIENQVNHMFSPFSVDSCIATFGRTQFPLSNAKKWLTKKLISLGVDPDMPLHSQDECKLQLLTAVLTNDTVTPEGHTQLNASNVFLGEYLLQKTDSTNEALKNLRQEFKETIQTTLAQKFGENLNLDYSVLWTNTGSPNAFLKVISVIRFKDEWQGKPFENIGLKEFNTPDNKQIQTEFIEKTICGRSITHEASNWKAIRLFYKQKYAIDIILPAENDQSTNNEKQQIIYFLMEKLNENKIQHRYETSVSMPKFEYQIELDLSNYFVDLLDDFSPDYRGFLENTSHGNLLEVSQKCYIKIDKKGTTAEAITSMSVTDGAPPVLEEFVVNRNYFFVLSEYIEERKNHNPLIIKKIIMMGEVANPSEQLVVVPRS